MLRFRDFSIKTKLTIFAVTSSAVALALCCLGFMSNDARMLQTAKVEQCRALAAMLSFNGAEIAEHRDRQAGEGLLQALKSQAGIDSAALFDAEGRALAVYDRHPQAAPAPRPIAGEGQTFTESGLEVWRPIVAGGRQVGSLVLRANIEGLRTQLYDSAKITLFVIIFALNVVVFFTSCVQKVISKPILDLAETARRISEEGDYSVRGGWDSDDEIGGLHMSFNLMLDHIEASEAALQKAHSELEQRVHARTAQLRSEISEREKVQDDLEHARDAAENANRAKSAFLANMSHEIRTPLNAVLGFTDLLRMGGDDGDPAKRQEYLDLIHTSGEHLLILINDILDLSKIESGKLEIERLACSPQQILADVVSVLRVRANEKGVALEYRWESGVPETVVADAGRLRQLLMNLVSNAVKFTGEGHVQVVGRMLRGAERGLLAFDVIDTGVGIPKEKWDVIFDPFVQADTSVTRKFGGTGLGLAISRRIVEAMGGTLTVESEIGKGSVFTATIEVGSPQTAALAGAARADIVTAPRPSRSAALEVPRGRVLVVEDGDTNRKLIDLILRRAGLEVVTAENGKLGVDAALAGAFDLILMDMQMPVMDGYTAAQTLRQHGMRLPIVALTAHAMAGDEQKCRAAGCSGFITKPIRADMLLRTVAESINRWHASGAAPARDAPPASGGDNLDASGKAASCVESVSLPPPPSGGEAILSSLPTDDPDFREIVEEFVDRLHAQMEAMQQALGRGDLDELARLAHWLKGAGGSVGFASLTASAKRLETLVKDEQCDEIEKTIEELLDMSARIVKPSATAASGASYASAGATASIPIPENIAP